MGIYYNPTNEIFRRILASGIYVDKTGMIEETNHYIDRGFNYICMSRPRRFGKTMAGNMISAYYSKGSDSHELFDDLKIAGCAGYEDKLNKYNVIKLDLNSEYQNTENKSELFNVIREKLKREIQREYDDIDFCDYFSLADYILEVYSKTSEQFVIIIDEYDVLVREEAGDELFDNYLSFLNGLFKSDTLRPAIALAYLTGILPIVRDKVQSKLNNFEEITILDAGEFTEFIGFTPEEVSALCDEYNMSFEECKLWYNGYHLNGIDLYNPESVIQSMRRKRFGNYWCRTSSYEVISDRLLANFKGMKDDVIKMLAGEEVPVNITRYLNTMNSFSTKGDVFAYLILLGYLAYDYRTETCRIPNREVRREWYNAIETESGYEVTNEIIESSKQLLADTIAGNESAVAKALDITHIHVTSNRSYNNEDALQSAIYLAYIYALNEYTVVREMTSGKGFADVVFIPIKQTEPALIMELKRNDSADSAIDQIKEKQYFDSLSNYQGDLLFVGINYDEKGKTHTCKIEKFVK